MNQKIKILLGVIGFWFILFLVLDWWNSYPRIKIIPVSSTNSKEEKLDSLLKASMTEFILPGLAVGIVEEGKITYQKAFGFQNLKTFDSLSAKSLIPVASISKLFTALTAAHYWSEQGMGNESKLLLAKPSSNSSSSLDELQISDLLSHQSGIPKPGLFAKLFGKNSFVPLSEFGKELWKKNIQKPDSLVIRYADENYDLIGYLLEQSSKLDFDSLVSEAVFQPAGMKNSHFATEWPEDDNSMTGYQETFVWRRIEPRRIGFERIPSPSSGLVSSLEELDLFLIHLIRGDMGIFQEEFNWLKRNSEGSPIGFQKITLNETSFLGHYGGQAGYSSLLIFSPEQKNGLVMISNARDTKDFRKEIAQRVLLVLSNPQKFEK
ncbi:serine hydrolase domain-containing protein [Algoriphagus pacificus]|uniref:Serine hydrolase n=1 Tax=Algoriphagus pacificus TaxID=2811234 RepID=A0ABS3CHZ6_9BACT|nr:serine hydrolase domain-containing protein [Algoriphagus pacificus]MBN7816375.1 serine hydrolase [Algoriphagus pacificus]